MTARSSRPKRQPSRDERSVAGAPTVVIGCPDGARLAALKCAIETNGQFATADVWPLERALAAGRNQATAVVVLDCFPSSLALRAMAEITFARSALSVLVLGPLEPNIDALDRSGIRRSRVSSFWHCAHGRRPCRRHDLGRRHGASPSGVASLGPRRSMGSPRRRRDRRQRTGCRAHESRMGGPCAAPPGAQHCRDCPTPLGLDEHRTHLHRGPRTQGRGP